MGKQIFGNQSSFNHWVFGYLIHRIPTFEKFDRVVYYTHYYNITSLRRRLIGRYILRHPYGAAAQGQIYFSGTHNVMFLVDFVLL